MAGSARIACATHINAAHTTILHTASHSTYLSKHIDLLVHVHQQAVLFAVANLDIEDLQCQ